MRRTRLLCLAITSLIGAAALSAATRPRYGGVLRVEMRERVNSMDPRDWNPGAVDAAAKERLLELVFDRLVRLDDSGEPQPALATAWRHNANFTHWQFQLRQGVKFHDGTMMSPAEVVAAIKASTFEIWPISVSGDGVAFDFEQPRPELPMELATLNVFFVFHLAHERVYGTGPFRIGDWQSQKRLTLIASEDCWAGRPFVERIEVLLGVTPQQQLIDLESGKADVVELLPSRTRRLSQSGERVAASLPVELYYLTVTSRSGETYDAVVSQVISLAVDREAIVNVLLQRQGEPAGSLLPQWISGYAYLFPTMPNLEQAKHIRAQFSTSPPVTLDYDGSDPVAMTLAQRIAVNVRDVGINLSVFAAPTGGSASKADVHLVRHRLEAPDASEALQAFFGDVMASNSGVGDHVGETPSQAAMVALDTPERRQAAERSVIDSGRIIPIVFVPEIYGLGPAVRDWMPPRWGGWRLEDVWLGATPRADAAGVGSGTGNN